MYATIYKSIYFCTSSTERDGLTVVKGSNNITPFLVSVYRYTYVMNMTAAVFSLCSTNNAVYAYLDNFTYISVTIGPSAVNFNEN